MRAAHDARVVSVLAVDDHAVFLEAVREDAPFGRHALSSAWARFGRAPSTPGHVPASAGT